MSDVSLIEAWSIWLSGDLPDSALLWGISILWWERIGKLMQITGAATIIADIVGPEKIRKFGTSLQSQTSVTMLIQFLRQCFSWYAIIFRRTILKDFTDNISDQKRKQDNSQLNFLNYLICFFLSVSIVYMAELYLAGWGSLLTKFVLIYACVLVSVSPLITVLAVVSSTVLGLAINSLVIQPTAWLLEHPSLDRDIKIASLILLLVGFHFELLAS